MLQSYTLQIHFLFQISLSLSTSVSQNARCFALCSLCTKKETIQYHKIAINISWLQDEVTFEVSFASILEQMALLP